MDLALNGTSVIKITHKCPFGLGLILSVLCIATASQSLQGGGASI